MTEILNPAILPVQGDLYKLDLFKAIRNGESFVFIDGKADRSLAGQLSEMIRKRDSLAKPDAPEPIQQITFGDKPHV